MTSYTTMESEDNATTTTSITSIPTPPSSMNHNNSHNSDKAQWLKDRKERKHRLVAIAKEFKDHTFSNQWIEMAQRTTTTATTTQLPPILPTPVTEEAVATFLYHTPQLDKTQIGLYISKGPPDKYPFHTKVLKHFCKQYHPFPSSFSDAIRAFL